MSRRSIFTQPDSDCSFASDTDAPQQIINSSRSSSPISVCSSDESVELLEVVDNNGASDFQEITKLLVDTCSIPNPPPSHVRHLDASIGSRFGTPVFVDSSSDTGQATVGSSTSSCKLRAPKRVLDQITSGGDSSPGSSSQGTTFTPHGNTHAVPKRRSTRLKSMSDSAPVSSSRQSSVPGTMDKVTVSSSSSKSPSAKYTSDPNSEQSEHLVEIDQKRKLQVRLQRMSVDLSQLKINNEKERSNAQHEDINNGALPRTSRTRVPSTKCLESFNLEDLQLSPRRTSRRFTPSKKYTAMQHQASAKEHKTPLKTPSKRSNEPMVSDEDERMDTLDEVMKKSTILYDQQADVAGHDLFAFRTPKKRDGMAQLAALAPKTPQTPKTPKHISRRSEASGRQAPASASSKITAVKTPSRIRTILKNELSKFTQPETSDTDFSSDESDGFVPSQEESESESTEVDDMSDPDSNSSKRQNKVAPKKTYCTTALSKTPQTSGRATRLNTRNQQDFVPQSEEYFNHHQSKKSITSDRTLDRMKTPRLPHDHLFQLLATTMLSPAHELAITEMHNEMRQHFPKWLFTMNEGFNILLHGLGSKRNLLQQFHQHVLADQTVLVVNGFFPSLTIKDVLDSILVDILETPMVSRNHHEVVDTIDESLNASPNTHIFLIVHNIDGTMLRNDRAQSVLSRLAKINQIHLIASLDHINAPLLWDHTKLSNFNFSWWDVTTMLPYTEETAFENSMLVNNSGGLALSSMKNVFLSLTNNSRGIFLVIVRNQLNNKGNSNFQGMPFKDLYSRCREDFLVSSDVALRSQLTEFIDHNLVKMRRTSDGIEHLQIPLDSALLEQFLELQENND